MDDKIKEKEQRYNETCEELRQLLTDVVTNGSMSPECSAKISQLRQEEQLLYDEIKSMKKEYSLEIDKELIVNILTDYGKSTLLKIEDSGNVTIGGENIPKLNFLAQMISFIAKNNEEESKIELTPEFIKLISSSDIKLKAKNINLEGLVTANENFKILEDGSIVANNGTFTGKIFIGNNGSVIDDSALSDGIRQGASDGTLAVQKLETVDADIKNLKADKADITDLNATNAVIENLKANKADVQYLTANYATIKQLDATNANVTNLQANKADITDLNATNAEIENLKTNKADIATLNANIATINQALIAKATVADLNAANAKIANLETSKADISVLEANYATIKQLNATNANVTSLQTETANINKALIGKADVVDLNATNANVTNLQATKANITDLNAAKANINTLTTNLAEITTLVNGNLTSDNIQSMVITGDKFTVEDGFIKNAMIDSVNANKINTGTINTNNVSIQSNDGSMILQGNLQQFKDKNGKVRIQIGKDATGNFTFVLYDENGTGQLINQNGIQSSNAIADGLIVDSKVADNANIAGSKLDIDSVVTEVNNGTTSIKGTKIYLDDQKQSLNVAFNNMSTTVKGNTNTIQSHTTSINTMNGEISQLISDTTITKQDGTTVSLKDAYNSTVDTVNSHTQTIGSLETNLNKVSTGQNKWLLEMFEKGDGIDAESPITIKDIMGKTLIKAILVEDSVTSNQSQFGNQYLGRATTYVYLDEDYNWETTATSDDGSTIYINGAVIATLGTCTPTAVTVPFKQGWNKITWVYNEGIDGDGWDFNPRLTTLSQVKYMNAYPMTNVDEVGDTLDGDIKTVSSKQTALEQNLDGFKQTVSETYATKTALNTVDGKFADYSTTSVMNSAINQKANEITSTVSQTYATKTALNTVDGKFANYSTTSAMNSAINQKGDSILSTVSSTYATKTALNTVDGKFANYSTTSAMNSAINQKSDAILSTVSSTYTTKADFNNLSIGGTNLLYKSGNFKGNTGLWISNDGPSVTLDSSVTYRGYPTVKIVGDGGARYNDFIQLKPNTTYTYSVLAKASSTISGNGTNPLHMWVSATQATEHSEIITAYNSSIGTKWTKAWITFRTPNDADVYYMKPFIYHIGNATVWLANAKVEEGNKATDWSPAPADVDSSIAAVDGKFANYSTTSQMNSAINQKANEITSSVSQTYATKTEFDNLQVGGRNYLSCTGVANTTVISSLNSNNYYIYDPYTTYGNKKLSEYGLIAGDKLTVSFDYKVTNVTTYGRIRAELLTGDSTTSAYVGGYNTKDITPSSANGRYVATLTLNDSTVTACKLRIRVDDGKFTLTISNVKMEKGDRATAWTPAPEDIDSAISTVDGKFANYSTTSDMNSAINQKANEITNSVSSTYATKTSLKSANDNISSLTNRMQSAESKLTKDSLTTTIGNYYTTSSDVNGIVTSQGYATTSQLSQTTDSLTAKFSESGGYNLLRNGRALNGTNYWADNGGGLNVSASNPPTVDHKYFYTNLPSGMMYNGWVQLENNTHYIYSAKIFVPTSITGNKLEPLHYWCSSDQTISKNQATPVRSSHDGQTIPANKWVDVWVEYVTASSGNVWFKPFIYQSISNCRISVTDLMLCKGSIPCPYSPHPSEIYDGITQINKDGIKVYHNSIDSNSYTHMSSTGFYLKNKGTDIFKVDGNGLYIKGNGDFTGKVTANDGSIGGFTISNGKLVGTGGNGVGMSGNGTDWAFWAGSSTGGSAPFHVGHEGNLYATQAYITGTITGSHIEGNTIVGGTIKGTEVTGGAFNVEGQLTANKVVCKDIDSPKYPGVVTEDLKLYVSIYGNDDSELEDGATFASFDGLLDKLPKNLNGHEVRIEMATDITENVEFIGYHGGRIKVHMKGHALNGYTNSRMGSARIFFYSGYIGNSTDTSNGRGKIHPNKGYAVGNYTTSVACEDSGSISLYNIDDYGADNYLSGSSNKVGAVAATWGTIYISNVKYYGCDIGARANAGGRVHDAESYGVCAKYGCQSSTGGYITLTKDPHAGGKTANYTESDAGKVIVASGATFATGDVTNPGGTAPVVGNKTVTIKSTSGDTYRSTVYNNYKNDNSVRQGNYGFGNCNGIWLFGDQFDQFKGKNITKVVITIHRQEGGQTASVDLNIKTHNYKTRPSGNPSYVANVGTLGLAANTTRSKTITDTNNTIIAGLKAGTIKGIGLQSTYNSSHYAVCSGLVTIKVTYNG